CIPIINSIAVHIKSFAYRKKVVINVVVKFTFIYPKLVLVFLNVVFVKAGHLSCKTLPLYFICCTKVVFAKQVHYNCVPAELCKIKNLTIDRLQCYIEITGSKFYNSCYINLL